MGVLGDFTCKNGGFWAIFCEFWGEKWVPVPNFAYKNNTVKKNGRLLVKIGENGPK
jgi:hypothetical protein